MSWAGRVARRIEQRLDDWTNGLASRKPGAPGGPSALNRAFAQDDWKGGPFQRGGSSWDTGLLMGSGPDPGGSFSNWRAGQGNDITDDPVHRGIGRSVGSYFASGALGPAYAAVSGAAGGAAGADSVDPGSYDPGGEPSYDPGGVSAPSGDPGGITSGFPDPGGSGSEFPEYTPGFDSGPSESAAGSPDFDNVPYEPGIDAGGREAGGTNFDPATETGRGGGRSWTDTALRAGPLALSVAGQVANYRRSRDAAARMGQLGQPPNFAGIQSWQDSAIAASRQYFANSGLSNSTSAMQSENQIRQRAEEMRVNATLQQLNINDRYRAAAINMELRSDQQAIQQGAQFLSTYAQWMSWSDSMGY